MTKIATDFPLFSCLVVFVCGIVLAAATFSSNNRCWRVPQEVLVRA